MNMVIHSFAYCLDYLREQVADVGPSAMVAQPNGIQNHPAWVIGHLTYSCQAIGGEMGLVPWLPEDSAKKFGTGSEPIPDAAAYKDKSELLLMLSDAQTRIENAVNQLSDSQLEQPLPDQRFRSILPTVRHALTQVLVAHTAYHIGQMNFWRQAMKLAKIERPFI